ncbi:MAG: acyl-CoA thioesterase [Chloroflexi bacterium]|nr:acyl-CoA thioesterase [Chloroflexota bacterium]
MPHITSWDIWVRSTDVDADGVVNNAVYFQFFEQARLEHMADLGLIRRGRAQGEAEEQYDRSFTIAETRCVFRAPLRHRDWVTVRCWTSEVRTRSFSFVYEIRMRDDPEMPVAEGTSAQVWLDTEGKPTPLPPPLKESLERSMQ